MDAKLLYWSLALANMTLVVGFAARGVRAIRRGDVARHRLSMTIAAWLVLGFLLSYLGKRFWVGAENLSVWSTAALTNLYVHESFVAAMLIAGGAALWRGRQLARTRRVTGSALDPLATAEALRRHRRLGWTAVIAAVLGLLTASGILAGMFARSA